MEEYQERENFGAFDYILNLVTSNTRPRFVLSEDQEVCLHLPERGCCESTKRGVHSPNALYPKLRVTKC